jgi:hypothetical protein
MYKPQKKKNDIIKIIQNKEENKEKRNSKQETGRKK